MANEIKVNVNITDNGTASALLSKTKEINKAKTQLEKTAYRRSGGEGEQYANARGVAGTTGAAGRDFAKQAQGLGGLVHVYATFAANIFAVVTAFQALDKAFTSVRLEQAVNQMSVSTGSNLTALAKNLQTATGHAISFQEAMQFSSVGTAAGLTGKQIENLTVIAKGAANALGRDMTDAVRRMIQGTAKQEQEILDELGIFVKAKTAYDNYAKSHGTVAGDLSAAQRVQAYADAVASAGEKWKEFANIDDPFSTLTSNIKEVGIELLNVINSAIMPFMKVLSGSKLLIEGIIILVTTKLLKMAMPSLSESLKGMFKVDPSVVQEYEKSKAIRLQSFDDEITQLKKKRDSYRSAIAISAGPDTDKRKLATTSPEKIKEIAEQSIINKSLKDQASLEQAILDKQLRKGSTLENYKVNQNAVKKLASEMNVLKKEELAIVEKINALEASRLAISEEQHKSQKAQNSGMGAARKAVSDRYAAINQDLGSGDIGLKDKTKSIFGNLMGMISDAPTTLGKATNAFRALGVAGSLALRGIMAAMGPIMLAFAAWEIVIKPLLQFSGIMPEIASKVSEANDEMRKTTELAGESFKKLSNVAKLSITDYQQASKIRSNIYTGAVDEISKQDEVVSSSEFKSAGSIHKKKILRTQAEEVTVMGKNLLANTNVNTKGWQELKAAIDETATITERMKNKEIDLAQYTAMSNDVRRRAKDAVNLLADSEAKYQAILERSKAAIASGTDAWDAYLKKRGELADPNFNAIKDLGLQAVARAAREATAEIEKMLNLGKGKEVGKMAEEETTAILDRIHAEMEIPGVSKKVKQLSSSMMQEVNAINPMQSAAKASTLLGSGATGKQKLEAYDKALLDSILERNRLAKQWQEKILIASPVAGGSKGSTARVDYSTEAARAAEDTQKRKYALDKGTEGIDNLYNADIRTSQAEFNDREVQINKIKDLKEKARQEEFSKIIKANRDEITLANKVEMEKQLTLKTAQKAQRITETILKDVDTYNEKTILSTQLLKDKNAVLAANGDLTKEEVAILQKLNAKEAKKAQLKLDLNRSAMDVATKEGPGFMDTLQRGIAADTKEAEKNAKGPIQGTLDAFTKGTDASMNTIFDSIQTGSKLTSRQITDAFNNAASDIFKNMAIEQAKIATQSAVNAGIGGLKSLFGFATGGIMSSSGPLPLNTYATGGIASSPQLALFGEGRQNEAFVPLPDGKRIPVAMHAPKGAGNGQTINSGKTDINISIDNKGNAQSQGQGSGGGDPQAFAKHISSMIKAEMALQKAPGGMLYGGAR